ncbi:hypothetical protein XF_0700 [Xylella fastidiosa 9a5c]|uniref:Uncharacterized protein n=1 Tax=Xylella fastidiosa (strain 9a5c) TaxID=160492 RepID=Q9PFF9_XYLFA|nr:hypothetical protein XF_0700 [Xylella fastidiosa 9a5c]
MGRIGIHRFITKGYSMSLKRSRTAHRNRVGANLPVELVFPINQITTGDRHGRKSIRCSTAYECSLEPIYHREISPPRWPFWQPRVLDLHARGHGKPLPFSSSRRPTPARRNSNPANRFPHSTQCGCLCNRNHQRRTTFGNRERKEVENSGLGCIGHLDSPQGGQ